MHDTAILGRQGSRRLSGIPALVGAGLLALLSLQRNALAMCEGGQTTLLSANPSYLVVNPAISLFGTWYYTTATSQITYYTGPQGTGFSCLIGARSWDPGVYLSGMGSYSGSWTSIGSVALNSVRTWPLKVSYASQSPVGGWHRIEIVNWTDDVFDPVDTSSRTQVLGYLWVYVQPPQ